MIRINLLPTKEGRKKRSGQRTVAIAVALLLVELGALYMWGQTFEEELATAQKATRDSESKLKALQSKKKEYEDREAAKLELQRQNMFFDLKKTEKTGPPEFLKFLSYALTRKEDNLYNRDEIKAQEAASWAPGWDSDNVWIHSVVEEAADAPLKAFTLKGVARSHEDVAEFYRRLESGIYFITIDPVVQQVTEDDDFDTVELVSFEAYTIVTYSNEGELKMVAGNVPDILKGMIQAAPAPDNADDANKKDDGNKGGG